jgi:hypothetical protein
MNSNKRIKMTSSASVHIRQLDSDDIVLTKAMLTTFGEAFNEMGTYTLSQPSNDFLRKLLDCDYFIALAALKNGSVVGGIAAYELKKFEKERSEIRYGCCGCAPTGRHSDGVDSRIKENCGFTWGLCYLCAG